MADRQDMEIKTKNAILVKEKVFTILFIIMLSKAQISLIHSLQHKKYRKIHSLFVVEGLKSIQEFILFSWQIDTIYVTDAVSAKLNKIPRNIKCISVTDAELRKISFLNNPQGILALVKTPFPEQLEYDTLKRNHTLLLDNIQDPGNMGTIIRTAEWFGIKKIICSNECVDVYNPKVVQATMGSLSRLKIFYQDLGLVISACDIPTYGAVLDGESIYKMDFKDEGLIIMGNEGNGISSEILEQLDYRVTIPNYGQAESLNVAVATTIFCSELARRKIPFK